jgi:FeS assembly SUF system protein
MTDSKSQMSPRSLFGRIWPGKDKNSDEEMDGSTTETAPVPEDSSAVPRASIEGSAIPPEELERLSNDIIAALKTVYDPEIPADIYELGLIYHIDIDDDRNVAIEMTLTAPACPVAEQMPGWVENAVGAVPGVGQVDVKMVFEPPWSVERGKV